MSKNRSVSFESAPPRQVAAQEKCPQQFRKKPVVIEALQYDGTNQNAIKRFTQGGCYTDVNDPNRPLFMIRTLEGEHVASVGDYIIKGVKGEFYPCKPEIFDQTYEPEIPSPAATTGQERCPNCASNDRNRRNDMSYGYCNEKWHNASIATTQYCDSCGLQAHKDGVCQFSCPDPITTQPEPKPTPQAEGFEEWKRSDAGSYMIRKALPEDCARDAWSAAQAPLLARLEKAEARIAELENRGTASLYVPKAQYEAMKARLEVRIAELESAQPKAEKVEKLVSDEDLQNLITSTFNTIKLLAIELQQRRQREERRER